MCVCVCGGIMHAELRLQYFFLCVCFGERCIRRGFVGAWSGFIFCERARESVMQMAAVCGLVALDRKSVRGTVTAAKNMYICLRRLSCVRV